MKAEKVTQARGIFINIVSVKSMRNIYGGVYVRLAATPRKNKTLS